MIVILGTHIPNRIRGVLQIWMIEPKPNVFIGNVNKVIESKIIEFIQPYLNTNSDIMIIRNAKNIQGFLINYALNSDNRIAINNALTLHQKRNKPLLEDREHIE